jgi:hypothetical protein
VGKLPDDEFAALLAIRIRTFIYAWNGPISRLSRDVPDIERFLVAKGPLTPQLRLACEWPQLTPASAALIDVAVGVWGFRLQTTRSGRFLVGAMASAGPIAAAETFLLARSHGAEESLQLKATVDAFATVFAHYPEAYLEPSKQLLGPYCRSADGPAGADTTAG